MKEVFRHTGLPKLIISDRNSKFTGNIWKALHKNLDIKLAMSSTFHPQTDGQTERTNQTLEEVFRSYVLYDQSNWEEILLTLEFS